MRPPLENFFFLTHATRSMVPPLLKAPAITNGMPIRISMQDSGTVTTITAPSDIPHAPLTFCVIGIPATHQRGMTQALNQLWPDQAVTLLLFRGRDYAGAWLKRAVQVAQYTVIDPAHVPLFVEELVPTDRLHRIREDYQAAFALIRRRHTI